MVVILQCCMRRCGPLTANVMQQAKQSFKLRCRLLDRRECLWQWAMISGSSGGAQAAPASGRSDLAGSGRAGLSLSSVRNRPHGQAPSLSPRASATRVQLRCAFGHLHRSGFDQALHNRSLEWTSASWPRYAACILSAPRGHLAPATQLQLQGLPPDCKQHPSWVYCEAMDPGIGISGFQNRSNIRCMGRAVDVVKQRVRTAVLQTVIVAASDGSGP